MIGAVSVIRDHVPRWKGMAGEGKGLPKKEIDFEHETIGGIGKGARDGLWKGGRMRHLIPTFGLLFSDSLLEQASF